MLAGIVDRMLWWKGGTESSTGSRSMEDMNETKYDSWKEKYGTILEAHHTSLDSSNRVAKLPWE